MAYYLISVFFLNLVINSLVRPCSLGLKQNARLKVIAYYSKHGSLFCVMLDATKAIDRVDYCELFGELLDRALPREYLRLLLNMYTNHVTRVSWNGVCSARFLVKMGLSKEVWSALCCFLAICKVAASVCVSVFRISQKRADQFPWTFSWFIGVICRRERIKTIRKIATLNV